MYLRTPDHAIPLSRPEDDPVVLTAGQRIAALGLDPTTVCSWRSTYLRCAQTEALLLRQAFGASALDTVRRRESFLLREQEFGDWDGLTEEQMKAKDPEKFDRRARMSDHHGRFYFRYPSGESRADVVQRLVAFFGKVRRSRYPHHIVVLHGVTQRAFRMAWCNRSVEWFESEPNPENGSVLVLQRDASRHWADSYVFSACD